MTHCSQLSGIAETASKKLGLAVATPVHIFRKIYFNQCDTIQMRLELMRIIGGRKPHANLLIARQDFVRIID